MIPPEGRTQTTAVPRVGAVSLLWALWLLHVHVLLLTIPGPERSCPTPVPSTWAQEAARKSDLAAGSRGFVLARDGERDGMAGSAGHERERLEPSGSARDGVGEQTGGSEEERKDLDG